MNYAGYEQGEVVTNENIFASDFPRSAKKVTIAAGQDLTEGAVLGKITVGGEYALSASAAGDGSEEPDAILSEDINTTGAAAEAMVWTRGDFRKEALTFGAGHDADSVSDPLRAKGITLT